MLFDVTAAFLCGFSERPLFMEISKEDPSSEDPRLTARLVRSFARNPGEPLGFHRLPSAPPPLPPFNPSLPSPTHPPPLPPQTPSPLLSPLLLPFCEGGRQSSLQTLGPHEGLVKTPPWTLQPFTLLSPPPPSSSLSVSKPLRSSLSSLLKPPFEAPLKESLENGFRPFSTNTVL